MDNTSSASTNGGPHPQPAPVMATPTTFSIVGNGNSGAMPVFPSLSATTAELLARARANAAGNGTPGYEAAREQLMRSMMMSDKLPVPVAGAMPKRGRGGRKSRGGADGRSPSESTPGSTATPTSERGRGKVGRPRGRGRGGGRGGKRKRSESVDSDAWNDPTSSDSDADGKKKDDGDDDASDVSVSYTPLPKVTKSGRSVNKPTQYVPVIPEPTSQPNKKKRPYRRNIDAAVCKMCHRPTSPTNNQIVFCDGCGTPYHQYCHDPPIENEVVEVQEKEWFCAECTKSREGPQKGDAEGLIPGESLTMDEKRSRLSLLPQSRLIDLLLRASSLQPTLPLFPALIPSSQTNTTIGPALSAHPIQTTTNTFNRASNTIDITGDGDAEGENEPYDGYDTDPPAHYPKPGNGLARTLRPEAEDLEWLVDENEDVFSHQVRPLGLGLNGGDVGMSGT